MDTKPLMMLTTGEAALVITSTGIKGTMTVPHPMNVIQIGFIVTTAPTVTVPVIAFDRRIHVFELNLEDLSVAQGKLEMGSVARLAELELGRAVVRLPGGLFVRG